MGGSFFDHVRRAAGVLQVAVRTERVGVADLGWTILQPVLLPNARLRGWDRSSTALCALFALLFVLAPSCAQAPQAPVESAPAALRAAHVHVEGEIDVGTQALLARAIRAAKSEGASTLVLEIDTPGGSIEVLWQIQKQLLEAESEGLDLVAWIHGHAVSAGAFVALVCPRIYIASSGTIGSAMPVTVGPEGIQALPEEGGVREKQTSFLRSQFASMAEKRGRPPSLAVAMVDADVEVRRVKVDGESRLVTGDEWDALRQTDAEHEMLETIVPRGKLLNLTAKRAVELGLADGIADSLPAVLAKVGVEPQAVSSALVRSRSEDAVAWIQRLSPLLLLGAIVFAWTEIKQPGFGLPGILAIACLTLLVAGKWLAGLADIPHIVAIALGAALVAVEVFLLPGMLWAGIAGAVLIIGGLVLGSIGPGFDLGSAIDRDLVIDASFSTLGAAAVAVVAALVLSRFVQKTPVARRLVLTPPLAGFGGALPEADAQRSAPPRIGALGRALTDLRPVGKVALDADPAVELEARAHGAALDRGERVRVVEVSVGRLVVEPLVDTPDPAGAP